MRWFFAAHFLKSSGDQWIGAFVPGGRHRFETVPARHAHDAMGPVTSLRDWVAYFRHAWRVMRRAHAEAGSGVITCFPQLPVACGLLSYLFVPRVPIVAWTFNVGRLPVGPKRLLSKLALRRVDALIVHSIDEIDECVECFGIERAKVIFVPLQSATRPRPDLSENRVDPYLLAMGSANRDYRLLFEGLRARPFRTVVVAAPHALEDLSIPPCVELRSGLSREECHGLLQGARVSVIPVENITTASGQVTLLDSMAMSRATVVTRCPGSVDYVLDGVTGVLVEPGDAQGLMQAIDRMWRDDAYRDELGRRAFEHLQENFSDAAIGKIMGSVCDAVETGAPLQGAPFRSAARAPEATRN